MITAITSSFSGIHNPPTRQSVRNASRASFIQPVPFLRRMSAFVMTQIS
jgi:hypothetical protein